MTVILILPHPPCRARTTLPASQSRHSALIAPPAPGVLQGVWGPITKTRAAMAPKSAAQARNNLGGQASVAPEDPANPQSAFLRESSLQLPKLQLAWSTPFDRDIWALFLPALIALVLEPVQQMADSMIIGKLGVAQLGAAGLGTVLFQFTLGFLSSLIFTTTPNVAEAVARGDHSKASQRTAHGMWVALVFGVALQVALWLKAPDIINFMASDSEVAQYALLYLRGRCWGITPALVMMVGIGACRGVKDMRTPLLGSLVYLLALVAADLGLIFGAGLGMTGAGYAAALAQWLAAVAMLVLMILHQGFNLHDMLRLPSLSDIHPYLRQAVSLSINNLSALAPTLAATSLATSLGSAHLGAFTLLRQISGFWWQGFLAFNATAHSLISTALSRRKEGQAAQIISRIAQLAVGSSLVLGLALYFGRDSMPGLFTSDARVVGEVADVLPILLLLMPLDALGTVLEGGLLGASDTSWIAARATFGAVLSLGALALVAAVEGRGLLLIWLAMRLLNLAALAADLARFLGLPDRLQWRGRRRGGVDGVKEGKGE